MLSLGASGGVGRRRGWGNWARSTRSVTFAKESESDRSRHSASPPRPERAIVLLSLMLAVAALSPVAASAKEKTVRLCKGAQSGIDIVTPSGPGVLNVTSTGSGHAPHIGRFSFRTEQTFTAATGTSAGTTIVTVPNGDTITGSVRGVIDLTPNPAVFKFRIEITITGGTGRFAGATGIVETIGTAVIVFVDPTTGESRNQTEAIICTTSNGADDEDD